MLFVLTSNKKCFNLMTNYSDGPIFSIRVYKYILVNNDIQIILLKCFIFLVSKKPKYVNVINQDALGFIRVLLVLNIST